MIQETWASGRVVFPLEFWVVAVSFSLRGHCLDTYRTVCVGDGAFELCLPSLGFFLTKLTLRYSIWAISDHMTKVWTLAEHGDLQHYEVVGLVGERAYRIVYHEAHSDHHDGHGQGFEHSLHVCVFNPCGR